MTKVLVACADYPREDRQPLQFVHVRNKYYIQNGIDVTVLNFACKESYVFEGINVISLQSFYENKESFQHCLLLCHAPNLRNHYGFLRKNGKNFGNIIFFFHGHEVVSINDAYPKPYSYIKFRKLQFVIHSIYDKIKLRVWRKYFLTRNTSSPLIFVSKSLENDFLRSLKMQASDICDRAYIINNSVGVVFEKENYDVNCQKTYDFITIRSMLDSSTYCIDLVNKIAKRNANKKFLVVGHGDYFKHNEKAENITLINNYMKQEALIDYINMSKVALMPTRRDTQGVMSCELATFGIPLITSDLSVCKEMFGEFENVKMYSEKELLNLNYDAIKWKDQRIKNKKYFQRETIAKEIDIIKNCGGI